MKCILRALSTFKQTIAKKILVLMILLSFLGQAFAAASVCTMRVDTLRSVSTGQVEMIMPCHQEPADMHLSVLSSMDCCDDDSIMLNHDCSCPNSTCSGSVAFISGLVSNPRLNQDSVNHFLISHFPSQIDSALFRPPIA